MGFSIILFAIDEEFEMFTNVINFFESRNNFR